MVFNIDPEIWKNWEKNGKANFLKLCFSLLRDKTTNLIFANIEIVDYITLLIFSGIQEKIRKEFVVSALQELIVFNSGVVHVICDALNVADANTSLCANYKESQERHNFGYVVQECMKLIPAKLLQERLEIGTLDEFGILKICNFNKKIIKMRSKLYYKQQKFNLFLEESEGYSKLLTALNQNCDETVPTESLLDTIQSLIGCFSLDPNKVLVVVLESFEQKPGKANFFVPLIRSFMNDQKVIAQVLGYEFSFCKRDPNGSVPESLTLLTAQLLQHDLVLLNDVYVYLEPEDRTVEEEWRSEMTKAQDESKKIDGTTVTFRKAVENEEAESSLITKPLVNQKVCICENLLNVGDWKNAKDIIDRLPPQFVVGFESVAIALCRLIHYVIEPVYRENFKFGKQVEGIFDYILVPKAATTFLELRDVAMPMLLTLGPSLSFDHVLIYKITRLSRAVLNSYGVDFSKCSPPKNEDCLYWDIVNLLDVTILPTLSILDCNSCVAQEIWSVVKLFPYQIRYYLYGRWKNESYLLYPDLLRKRCRYVKTIKTTMKSVTKENVKPFGRTIGKLANCSPTIIFDYILIQIQLFDNFIILIVESLKYLTGLAYDVLAFSLIEILSNAEERRAKYDGTSISSWLKSLAIFCGALFKKYDIELTGLLQFFANQLKLNRSVDLIILNEVIRKMAGIEVNEDMTISQLHALAGGELLKAEAAHFSQIRNVGKSSMRLRNSMAEQNLAVALCLLTAQQTNYLTYHEKEDNLKFVGSLIDQCQDTVVQLGTFLGYTSSNKEFFNSLPPIRNMLVDYHIPKEVAFFLARPKLNNSINNKFNIKIKQSEPSFSNLATKAKQMKYLEAVKEVMEPINDSIIPLYPVSAWQQISPQLFTTFWSLSLSDIFVPDETYQKTVDEAKEKHEAILNSPNLKNTKKELERTTALIERLRDENRRQNEHKKKIGFRLNLEKSDWFLNVTKNSIGTDKIIQFLNLCLIPRCTFSQIDALYCAKFIYTTHMMKTPNFPTLLCYDKLLNDITFFIRSSTENETVRYGRFLCDVLETTMRWHKSKEVFENECEGYPGFMVKYRINQSEETRDHVRYENYRHLCCKWQKQKLVVAITNCLDSKEFVQIRNSLTVLIKILPHFPLLCQTAETVVSKIENLIMVEKHKRPDLELLAKSYLGQLRQKISSGCMIEEDEFHQISQNKSDRSEETDGSVKSATKCKILIDDSISITTVTSESFSSVCNNPVEKDLAKEEHTEDEDIRKPDGVEKYVERGKTRNNTTENSYKNNKSYRNDRYKFTANYKSYGRNHRGNNQHFEQRRYSSRYAYVKDGNSSNNGNGSRFNRNYNFTESENPNKRRKI